MTPPGRGLAIALGAFVAATVVQRLFELALSARHARALRAMGGVERARGHFAYIVLVHTLYLPALAAEVVALGARPGAAWPLWLALWLGAQGLRAAAMRALGVRWTTRIWVLPGAPLVTRGPYRWLRHPNYLAVAVELAAGPLLFGAWRTALAISALDAVALAVRIRAENRALRDARGA